MTTHLFVFPTGPQPSTPTEVGVTSLSDVTAETVANEVSEVLLDRAIDVVVLWDPQLGAIPWAAVSAFKASLDDAWHPGRGIREQEVDLVRHVRPLWLYRPAPEAGAPNVVSWRLDAGALFLRANTLRALGGFDPQFETVTGQAYELGLRMLKRGGVCRQRPDLLPRASTLTGPSLADAYRLLRREAHGAWRNYAVARRILSRPSTVITEVRAWRSSRDDVVPEHPPLGVLHREIERAAVPAQPTVSVILPTYGRYKYVAEVLGDLRAQSIVPTQILVADGNPPEEREPQLYDQYSDLPIEVLWHEEPGICSGRNACLQRATGDYVWFVDDDSRFDANNLESHLRVMAAYGADVSVGPAYMKGRPELTPEQSEIASSFMDCGTTVCRRSLLAKVGGFDMQFNRHLAGEDNELGIRFVKAGAVMLNNPLAKRFHYLAPVGGSRSKGSVHVFRRWSLRPRPVQSVYYLARRHFDRSAAWDAMLQACISVGWRRRDAMPPTRMWRLKNLVAEIAALPLTAFRFAISARIGRRMFHEGPQIPALPIVADDAQRGRITPK